MISLLVFHCNYITTVHRFPDIIVYFPKFRGRVIVTTPTRGTICHAVANTSHDQPVYYIKFEVFSFNRSRYIFGNTKNLKWVT